MGTARVRRRIGRLAGAAALVLLAAVMPVAVGQAAPAAADPVGCGYADSSANNGLYASTICWFDFTDFDMAQARSVDGQPMQVTLDGGYVASFTVHFADVAGTVPMSVERRATPLETRFAFGTDAYRGVPGLHTLYSLPSPAGVKGGRLSFEDIQIVDSLGANVTGYSFVAADTEDNVLGESFAWSSDSALNEIERLAPAGGWGCKTPVGLGTTDVSCAGTGVGGTTTAGGKSTALLVAAESPTRFSAQWITGARSGLAVGIQTAKVTVVKQVASRVAPGDSFTVAITGSTGTVLDSATTGAAASASTDTLTVLAGEQFTLSDAAAVGSPTNLANYDATWSCTNANAASATVLPAGSALSQTLTPGAGDDITCTVTNAAKAAQLSLIKSSTPSTAAAYQAGQVVNYDFEIVNTGDVTVNNVQIDETAFSGTGSLGSISCPAAAATLDPTESATCTATYTLTQADVDSGSLVNTARVLGDPVGFPAPIASVTSTTTLVITAAPAVGLVKSAPNVGSRAGDAVDFEFAVTNLGNVSLANPVVTETSFSGSGPIPVPSCPIITLLPGQRVTCTASYVLTAADVAAGSLSNTADVSATAPGGAVVSASAAVVAPIPDPPLSGLALTGGGLTGAAVGAAGLLLAAGVVLAGRRRRALS